MLRLSLLIVGVLLVVGALVGLSRALPKLQEDHAPSHAFILRPGVTVASDVHFRRPGARALVLRLPFDVAGEPQQRALDLMEPGSVACAVELTVDGAVVAFSVGSVGEAWALASEARTLEIFDLDVPPRKPARLEVRIGDVPEAMEGLHAVLAWTEPPYDPDASRATALAAGVAGALGLLALLAAWVIGPRPPRPEAKGPVEPSEGTED